MGRETAPRWILVADASRARLFSELADGWQLIERFEHAESRQRVRDLVSDAQGRKPAGPSTGLTHGSGGAVSRGLGRPGVEPDTDPKVVESEKFARELVTRLEHGINERAFDDVVIVAPPKFLGELRSTMSPQLEGHVHATVNKDLTNDSDADVREHVAKELAMPDAIHSHVP